MTAEGSWFEVKPSKIDASKIMDEIAIRYGKPSEDGKRIELIESATFPVFREDTIELVKKQFKELGFTAKTLFPKDELAETRFNNLLQATIKVTQEIPLQSYNRSFVDKKLNKVSEYEKYYVTGINETSGVEQLAVLPYYEKTHQIFEKDDTGKLWILPSIYWDIWLPESYYELAPYTDEDRFGLARLVNKLEDYPIPTPDGKVEKQEAMLYKEGYIAQSGASSGYYALIRGKKVIGEDKEEKFTLEMKISKSIFKYQHLVPFPKKGEIPATVGVQKPIMQMGVAELLAGIKA